MSTHTSHTVTKTFKDEYHGQVEVKIERKGEDVSIWIDDGTSSGVCLLFVRDWNNIKSFIDGELSK